jgi:hypothetical protein
MPLQNRVDPFGSIHAVPERGMFTGNRGIIHDPATKTLLNKRWTIKAWIICACEFRGRRREPMGRNGPNNHAGVAGAGWTELFFLDEVTALAAGHRPCFYCRRGRALDFIGRFGTAFDIEEPRAPMLDSRLHRERLASSGTPGSTTDLSALPDGAMVADGGTAYALRDGMALRWSFAGYGDRLDFSALEGRPLKLLTPPTTVEILRAGYRPVCATA